MAKCILIGAAGLDWAAFQSQSLSGALPHLSHLRDRGIVGALAGAANESPVGAWTTISTGLQPEDHGVWSALEAWPGGMRPASRASWQAPAIWERLEAAGIATGSVGWPASRPGADWPGMHVDDEILEASARRVEDWAVPMFAARPELREAVRDRRVHPADITAEMLAELVPDLIRIDQSRDATLPALAVAMAEAATAQSISLWMLHDGAPEAMFFYQPWLMKVRLAFEGAADPMYAHVLLGAWRFLDGLVGHLIRAAPADALVMFVSTGWGRQPGVVIAAGPGVATGTDFVGAHVLDIAPTMLGCFGLRCDELPGHCALAFGAVEGRSHAPLVRPRSRAEPDQDLLDQAAQWGFHPPPAIAPAWRAQSLSELATLILWRRPSEAARIAGEALAIDPACITAMSVRAFGLALSNEPDGLLPLAGSLQAAAPERGWGALAQGTYHILRNEPNEAAPFLAEAERDPDPTTRLTLARVWITAKRLGPAERLLKTLSAIGSTSVQAHLGMVTIAMHRRDFPKAELMLIEAMRTDPASAGIYILWASLCAQTGRPEQARHMGALAYRFGATSEQVKTAMGEAWEPVGSEIPPDDR